MGQLQGHWRVRNENISILYEEAKKLKDAFLSVKISHVQRVCEIEFASLLCFMTFLFGALWYSASKHVFFSPMLILIIHHKSFL